jgi:nucleoside-diphosphate-sugar epimerase
MHVVTGATGRLGKHLVAALLSRGKEVKALVMNKEEKLPQGVLLHVGDITKPDTLSGLVGKKDTVFHLAAVIDDGSGDQPSYNVNVLGTQNVLDACKGNDVARFVFVSSISVFGELESVPADENCQKNPVSRYGKSKLLAEEIVMRKWKDVPSVIIRPAMIYGPGFDEGYLPVFKMLEQKRMPIIGDGKNRIPLIHISDVIEALLLVSEAEDAVRYDFNIVGPGYPTQGELLSMACKELGVEEPTRSIPLGVAQAMLPMLSALGKVKLSQENLAQLTRDRAFDASKIKKKLGFVPKVSLSQGIKEMVAYYRERKVMA